METAIIVEHQPHVDSQTESTAELNRLLTDGWVIKNITPMGGGGNTPVLASLVILEKPSA